MHTFKLIFVLCIKYLLHVSVLTVPSTRTLVTSQNQLLIVRLLRGGAVKSLSRPRRKQATATKLGIYSTYSPWSSIQFLALCSNFYKPLKKNIQKVVRPTRYPRQQWPPRRTKNGDLSVVFFQYREKVAVRRGQIRIIGWVIKTLEA